MVNNMKDKKSNKTDNVVYMGGSEEALKNNKEAAYRARKQKSIKLAVLLAAIIIAAVCVIVLLNREYHGYKVQEPSMRILRDTSGFVVICSNIHRMECHILIQMEMWCGQPE